MPPDTDVSPERPAVLRVGEWVIYPRLCRAERAGIQIHLRAQVIDLLVVLTRRPGHIVSKQDVMAALWPGVYVSSSALSRCMAELRQVFEDDAKNPWLIETIAKRGYRVIAQVEITEHDPAGVPVAITTPSLDVDGAAVPTRTAGESRTASRRGMSAARWVVLALVATTGIVAAWWAVTSWRAPTIALSAQETVVLADVVNTTGDRSFDGAVRLALAIQLEQAPFLRVISDERVRETLALMKRDTNEPVVGAVALEVCRREGGAVVLAGSIAPVGKRLAVGVEAITCRQGESVARVIEQIDSADRVLEAVGRVASALRAKLGESQASLRANDVPVARATTASLDALRAMSLGDAKRDGGSLVEALDSYRQATAIDPQFAVAWARLGTQLAGLGRPQDASAAFATAFQLAGRTSPPERYYITAHYHLNVTGRIDLATDALQSWKRLYAGSASASLSLAAVYTNEWGRYEDALAELRIAEPLSATGATSAWVRINALLALGRTAEAKRALGDPRFRSEFDPYASVQRARIAWFERDGATLRAEVERATSRGGEHAYRMLEEQAGIAMIEGRAVESRRLYGEAVALAATVGDSSDAATTHMVHALAEAAVGYGAEAKRAATAGLQLVRNRDTYLRAAMAFALAGDRLEARRLFELAQAAQTYSARTDGIWIPTVGAAVDGIDRPADGLARLDAVKPYQQGFEFLLIPVAVRASLLQRAGRARDAVEACRTFVQLQGVSLTSSMLPLARVTLARALVAAGDVAAGREAYKAFLDSWRNADPDAPLLRQARAEYEAVGPASRQTAGR